MANLALLKVELGPYNFNEPINASRASLIVSYSACKVVQYKVFYLRLLHSWSFYHPTGGLEMKNLSPQNV